MEIGEASCPEKWKASLEAFVEARRSAPRGKLRADEPLNQWIGLQLRLNQASLLEPWKLQLLKSHEVDLARSVTRGARTNLRNAQDLVISFRKNGAQRISQQDVGQTVLQWSRKMGESGRSGAIRVYPDAAAHELDVARAEELLASEIPDFTWLKLLELEVLRTYGPKRRANPVSTEGSPSGGRKDSLGRRLKASLPLDVLACNPFLQGCARIRNAEFTLGVRVLQWPLDVSVAFLEDRIDDVSLDADARWVAGITAGWAIEYRDELGLRRGVLSLQSVRGAELVVGKKQKVIAAVVRTRNGVFSIDVDEMACHHLRETVRSVSGETFFDGVRDELESQRIASEHTTAQRQFREGLEAVRAHVDQKRRVAQEPSERLSPWLRWRDTDRRVYAFLDHQLRKKWQGHSSLSILQRVALARIAFRWGPSGRSAEQILGVPGASSPGLLLARLAPWAPFL